MTPLLRSRRFFPVFVTQFCGALNDNILKNALVILVTYRSITVFGIPPEQMVALAGGIFILPFFLFSATAGQLADRHDKSRVIVWVKVSEVAIMVLATYGFLRPDFPALLVSGTIVGGVLVSIEGGPFWVSVALVIVAVVGLLASRMIPPAPSSEPNLKTQWNLVSPTLVMLKIIWQERFLFRLILANSWFWYFGATVLSLFPLLGKNVVHTDEGVVTLFLAIFSVGVGLGSILCGWLSHHKATVTLSARGLIGMSVFAVVVYLGILPLSISPASVGLGAFFAREGAPMLVMGLLGLSVSGGVFIVPLYTLIQERSNPAMRSRIIAGNNIVNAIFMVAAALVLAALLKQGFAVPSIFLLLAAANAISLLFLFRIE
ncbi:MAG: MFS transporter [Deltaproteobacteria bacterium]|nr:MFS transporter [Deltaproteobacteria bacterium]